MKEYKIHLVASNKYEGIKTLLEGIGEYQDKEIKASIVKWNYSFLALNHFLSSQLEEPDILLMFDNAEYSKTDAATGKNVGHKKMLEVIRKAKINLNESRIVFVMNQDKVNDKNLILELMKLDVQNFYFADVDNLESDEIKKWLFGLEKTLEDNKDYLESDEVEKLEPVIKYVDRIIEKGAMQTKVIEKEIIKERIKGTIYIAFAGAEENIGCTHAAYATAFYLSRKGYKTAYIEMGNDPVFYEGYREDKSAKEIEGGYKLEKSLDLYVKYLNGNVEIGKALSGNYNYIVFDLGYIFKKDKRGHLDATENFREMERATVPVLIGGGSKWQLENLVQASKSGHDNWRLYINFTSQEDGKEVKKAINNITNKEVFLSPYSPNCFRRNKEYEEFLEILLSDVLPVKIIKKNKLLNKLKLGGKK